MCDFMREYAADLIFGLSRKDKAVTEDDKKKESACFRCEADFWSCPNCTKEFGDCSAI